MGRTFMLTYTNQPHMDPSTPVTRYFSLRALIATIREQRLRVTRVDTFWDRHEGSVPKKQVDDQIPIISGDATARYLMDWEAGTEPLIGEDGITLVTRLRKAKTRSAHASCWAAGDELDALWQLHCTGDGDKGVGVALRTTLSRLKASVDRHDVYVSPVTYRHYHEGDAFTDELAPLLHKRRGYATEHEVRILKVDEDHYRALMPVSSTVVDLPVYDYLKDWSVVDTIEEILISPYADPAFDERVRQEIRATEPALVGRLNLSVLHERRNPAYF
jgi:hypothetical protein